MECHQVRHFLRSDLESANKNFRHHESEPGKILLNASMPDWIRRELKAKGYTFEFDDRTSGPINAIYIDHEHGTLWGGSSNHGEDYGIGW